jgi:hypothetical protein
MKVAYIVYDKLRKTDLLPTFYELGIGLDREGQACGKVSHTWEWMEVVNSVWKWALWNPCSENTESHED